MAGRPRKDATPEQRAQIEQLAKRFGQRVIARKLNLPWRLVRNVLDSASPTSRRQPDSALSWERHPAQLEYLRTHAGEQDDRRLAREVSRLGPPRTRAAVRGMCARLGLSLAHMRLDLTLAQAARLTGYSEPTLLAAIRRGELDARQESNAWRVWPRPLREWLKVVGAPRQGAIEDWDELWGLLLGQWGVTDETARKAAQRARKRTNGRTSASGAGESGSCHG